MPLWTPAGSPWWSYRFPGPAFKPNRIRRSRIKLAREAKIARAGSTARPERYAGFAHLAMQDPAAPPTNSSATVRDLDFAGAMVNGDTNGIDLTIPRDDRFWERMQALDVPLYLHPGDSYVLPYVLKGCDELLKPTWEWTTETSTHFLRLMFRGGFRPLPAAQDHSRPHGRNAALYAVAARQPGRV